MTATSSARWFADVEPTAVHDFWRLADAHLHATEPAAGRDALRSARGRGDVGPYEAILAARGEGYADRGIGPDGWDECAGLAGALGPAPAQDPAVHGLVAAFDARRIAAIAAAWGRAQV